MLVDYGVLCVNLYRCVCVAVCVFVPFVELETKELVMEDMRLALTEQEETQDQMEQVLEEKLNLIQELTSGKDSFSKGFGPRTA